MPASLKITLKEPALYTKGQLVTQGFNIGTIYKLGKSVNSEGHVQTLTVQMKHSKWTLTKSLATTIFFYLLMTSFTITTLSTLNEILSETKLRLFKLNRQRTSMEDEMEALVDDLRSPRGPNNYIAGADPELLNDDKERPIDLAKINAMNIKMQLCGFFYNDVNESTMFAKSSHDMLPNA